jgi:hypothetical protein
MPEPSFAVRLRDTSVTAIATVIGAVLTLVGVYLTGWFAYASKDEELRSHLVEVALGILREDPKGESDDMKKVRVWAIKLIARNSGVEFPKEAVTALTDSPLRTEEIGACTVVTAGAPDTVIPNLSPASCSATANALKGAAHWVPGPAVQPNSDSAK